MGAGCRRRGGEREEPRVDSACAALPPTTCSTARPQALEAHVEHWLGPTSLCAVAGRSTRVRRSVSSLGVAWVLLCLLLRLAVLSCFARASVSALCGVGLWEPSGRATASPSSSELLSFAPGRGDVSVPFSLTGSFFCAKASPALAGPETG